MEKVKSLAIIDDDNLFVFLIKKAISLANVVENINVFNNGLDALNYMKENTMDPEKIPDVIFLDLSMPVMDGWQFLEEFVKLMPAMTHKVRIYIVSSSISPHDISRARAISAVSDFLIKPISRERLIDLVTRLELD